MKFVNCDTTDVNEIVEYKHGYRNEREKLVEVQMNNTILLDSIAPMLKQLKK